MTEIVNYYAKNKGNFFEVAGPGSFNDPDMVCTFCNSITNRAGTYNTSFSVLICITIFVSQHDRYHDNFLSMKKFVFYYEKKCF